MPPSVQDRSARAAIVGFLRAFEELQIQKVIQHEPVMELGGHDAADEGEVPGVCPRVERQVGAHVLVGTHVLICVPRIKVIIPALKFSVGEHNCRMIEHYKEFRSYAMTV